MQGLQWSMGFKRIVKDNYQGQLTQTQSQQIAYNITVAINHIKKKEKFNKLT